MSSKKYVYLFESSFNPNTYKGDVRKIVMDELDYNKALVQVTDEWKERLPEELFNRLKIRLISLIIIDSVVDIVNNARLISCCYNNDYGTGNGFKFANIDSISINDFLDNPCHFCINHYYIKFEYKFGRSQINDWINKRLAMKTSLKNSGLPVRSSPTKRAPQERLGMITGLKRSPD